MSLDRFIYTRIIMTLVFCSIISALELLEEIPDLLNFVEKNPPYL